jgi:outer membrane biosynthesis protein TonB
MGQITMIHSLATSLLVASILMGCSSPPLQTYRIGSKVYQSEAAAEAALTGGKPKKVAGTLADQEIRLLRAPMPSMPEWAIRNEISDLVTVSILFNEEGNVESIVPKKYKYPVLLEAVLVVVRDWKIEPPVEAGRRVKTTAQQSFRFEVE